MNIIISLKPTYAEKILSGEKTVELRSRPIKVKPGTKAWIYTTRPKACIEAKAEIKCIYSDKPSNIWKRFKSDICISKKEFDAYVNGKNTVYAVELTSVRKIRTCLSLEDIRQALGNFYPPQFYIKLDKSRKLLGELRKLRTVSL